MKQQLPAVMVLVLLLLAGAVVLWWPARAEHPPIAAALVLSGPYAEYGKHYENGQVLALEWLRRKGVQVTRLPSADFGGDDARACEAISLAHRRDGVRFFSGLMGTSAVTSCEESGTLDALDIVVVDGAATGDGLSAISPNFFRTIPPDGRTAAEVAAWVRALGVDADPLLIVVETDWGTGIRQAYKAAFGDRLRVLPLGSADEVQNVAAALAELDRATPSAILLGVPGALAAAVLKAAPSGHPPAFGTDNLVAEFAGLAGPSADGVRYIVGESGEVRADVRSLHDELFGPTDGPLHPYTITAFNAFVAAAEVAVRSENTPSTARDLLTSQTFEGATGAFGFDSRGDFTGVRYTRFQYDAGGVAQPSP